MADHQASKHGDPERLPQFGTGTDARAAAYLECRDAAGRTVWGVGIDEDVATASVRAVLSAANGAVAFTGAIPDSLDDGETGPGFPIEVFNVLGAGDGFMSGLIKGWQEGVPLMRAGDTFRFNAVTGLQPEDSFKAEVLLKTEPGWVVVDSIGATAGEHAHTFDADGEYRIKFTVDDNTGGQSQAWATIDVDSDHYFTEPGETSFEYHTVTGNILDNDKPSIVTVEPNLEISSIYDRMPAMLRGEAVFDRGDRNARALERPHRRANHRGIDTDRPGGEPVEPEPLDERVPRHDPHRPLDGVSGRSHRRRPLFHPAFRRLYGFADGVGIAEGEQAEHGRFR